MVALEPFDLAGLASEQTRRKTATQSRRAPTGISVSQPGRQRRPHVEQVLVMPDTIMLHPLGADARSVGKRHA
jgi:hypothetical protein